QRLRPGRSCAGGGRAKAGDSSLEFTLVGQTAIFFSRALFFDRHCIYFPGGTRISEQSRLELSVPCASPCFLPPLVRKCVSARPIPEHAISERAQPVCFSADREQQGHLRQRRRRLLSTWCCLVAAKLDVQVCFCQGGNSCHKDLLQRRPLLWP